MADAALIIGGGAPNATLMSGALVAFEEAGVEFDVISTSGAGALIGLLYLAPAGGCAIEALKSTTGIGVSDAIYDSYPVNYKVFQKPGALAELYRGLLQSNPFVRALEQPLGDNSIALLLSDWMKLLFALGCPTSLNPASEGLCAPVPFLEKVVDFEALAERRERIYLNAYNIDDRYMQNFSGARGEITPDSVRAALAFPFLYPPYHMTDPKSGTKKYYYEGAAHDCLNYKALVENEPQVRDIVVFDVLGAEQLMRRPRNLYDAWMLSIIVPLVEIARDDTKLFREKYNREGRWNLLPVPFDIPADKWDCSLDWSRSNLQTLFDIGYTSAQRFLAGPGEKLRRRESPRNAGPRPPRRVAKG